MSKQSFLKLKESQNDIYKTFLCNYVYNQELWSIEIKALSYDDAKERLKAICNNGEIIGELIVNIPLTPSDNFLKNKLERIIKGLKYALSEFI